MDDDVESLLVPDLKVALLDLNLLLFLDSLCVFINFSLNFL